MKFLKFLQQDPVYKSAPCEVVVNVDHIVKIEPVWYEEKEGRKYRAYGGLAGAETLERGLQKDYMVYDVLGNAYDSSTASDECKAFIEELWLHAT